MSDTIDTPIPEWLDRTDGMEARLPQITPLLQAAITSNLAWERLGEALFGRLLARLEKVLTP
ncbi:MAG: hypothetical protein FWD63_05640 [Propionibacteriaceae bacterium]|nr:hypothetical protein [Propionibacteriaceae bacterium]